MSYKTFKEIGSDSKNEMEELRKEVKENMNQLKMEMDDIKENMNQLKMEMHDKAKENMHRFETRHLHEMYEWVKDTYLIPYKGVIIGVTIGVLVKSMF